MICAWIWTWIVLPFVIKQGAGSIVQSVEYAPISGSKKKRIRKKMFEILFFMSFIVVLVQWAEITKLNAHKEIDEKYINATTDALVIFHIANEKMVNMNNSILEDVYNDAENNISVIPELINANKSIQRSLSERVACFKKVGA